MNTLTAKELTVITAFINESLNGFGGFDEENNGSYLNAKDLAGETGESLQSIGGVMAQLLDKGLIFDCGESARGAPINDFCANPETCLLYPEIAGLVTTD
jgi:hypothetical protein